MTITKQEFIQKIKTKYPDYQAIDDNTLYEKIVTKYPEYKTQVSDDSSGIGRFVANAPLSRLMSSIGKRITPTGEGRMAQAVRSAGAEVGKINRGLVKGASLGYVDLPGEESQLAEIVGGVAPYMATGGIGTAVKGAKLLSATPRLARIAGAAAQAGTVGLARPAKSIEDRLKRGAGEAAVGGLTQAVPEAMGAIGAGIKKHAPGVLSKTSGTPVEYLKKAMEQPDKYLRPPLDKKSELNLMTTIKDEVVKNVDDVASFRYKTIEDAVAKEASQKVMSRTPLIKFGQEAADIAAGRRGVNQDYFKKAASAQKLAEGLQTGTQLNASNIKTQVSKYINEMIDAGVIDEPPKAINRLYARIDRYATKGYDSSTNKWTNIIKFEDMHKLKQDIYKLVGKAYGKGDFDDVVAGAYKVAAKTANKTMRDLSPEYAAANDTVKAMYDLQEEIGKKGLDAFVGKGGTRKFSSFFNDPEGRAILEKVEGVLPEGKRFMPRLLDLEEAQEIRKLFMRPKGQESLVSGGSAGAAAYYATRNLPLAAAVGGIAGASSSPAAIKQGIKGSQLLSRLKLPGAPLPGLIR